MEAQNFIIDFVTKTVFFILNIIRKANKNYVFYFTKLN